MMSPESICAENGIDLVYFDGRGTDSKGMFNKKHKVIAIDAYLNDDEKKKRIYHELGHKDHDPTYYERNREYCEIQADRCMIHHLLKEELDLWDDVSSFNYIHFMEKYELTSLADEAMVKEEFYGLIE
ncbi:ImmA/IrrE family metallo-endopeptidase [Streptococcus sp. 19428wC2_LYSM12]|uniref:ImmA/IrrE family metallo-endopeptidase n=1 Tax=unclassified Streptococcus TaxID=2608887 RepID=UPI001071BFFF|nr:MULTISPECIES: ImmA/IrrE family metallo-endopeptidase [unclassified Streptococcus]MBF0788218.1 ImmA/IrrE family metallo-endopeptidase [Streptococcus sp. 19428wC2_LYSM12]TFV04727.1 ImmA/IrrE family metallo-endopeptidase [Streptococcus sp. LYSM12]